MHIIIINIFTNIYKYIVIININIKYAQKFQYEIGDELLVAKWSPLQRQRMLVAKWSPFQRRQL